MEQEQQKFFHELKQLAQDLQPLGRMQTEQSNDNESDNSETDNDNEESSEEDNESDVDNINEADSVPVNY